jgi:mono/diheme cytochrome c family protein
MKFSRNVLIAVSAFCGTLAATTVIAAAVDLPEAPGKAQVVESCTQCHGADVIAAQPRSPDEWSQVVSQMIGNGASLTDEQYKTVVAYLSTNLAPRTVAAGAAPAPAH